jgi:threonine dehydratase
MGSEITRARIAAAEKLIRPHIRRTPVIAVDGADFGCPGRAGGNRLRDAGHGDGT